MAVTLLGVVLPGACYIAAIIPVYFSRISKQVHHQIMKQISYRQDGARDTVTDPITGETIFCNKADHDVEILQQHFTKNELRKAVAAGNDHRVLGRAIMLDIAFGLVLFAADMTIMALYPTEVVITFAVSSLLKYQFACTHPANSTSVVAGACY